MDIKTFVEGLLKWNLRKGILYMVKLAKIGMNFSFFKK